LYTICKQIAKTRLSRFGETMLEKTGPLVNQRAARAPAEISPQGGCNIDVLLTVFRLLANGRSLKVTPILCRKKFPIKGLHSHPFKNCIQALQKFPYDGLHSHPSKIVFRWKRIRVCQKGTLAVILYGFC